MTSRQVYNRISKKDGNEKLNAVLERIRSAHRLNDVSATATARQTVNGKEDYAVLLFRYDGLSKGDGTAYKNFEEARVDVIYLLKLFDLKMELDYTVCYDGDVLMWYRIDGLG